MGQGDEVAADADLTGSELVVERAALRLDIAVDDDLLPGNDNTRG